MPLHATAVAAALGLLREKRALLPGNDKRPADVFIPNWSQGRDTALDVTVISPMRLDLMAKEAETPGHALMQAYQRKMRQVGDACELQGIAFIPLPVETFGGWSDGAIKVLRRLGASLAGRSGRQEGEVIGQLFQRLNVLLQKGNAALLCNQIPTHPPDNLIGPFNQ